jgi:hypothetical protein
MFKRIADRKNKDGESKEVPDYRKIPKEIRDLIERRVIYIHNASYFSDQELQMNDDFAG